MRGHLACYCYFWNRPAGNLHGPCGRPGACGHHVGDPLFKWHY